MRARHGVISYLFVIALLAGLLTGCSHKKQVESSELINLIRDSDILPSSSETFEYANTSNTVYRMFFDNTNSMRGFVNPTIENRVKTAFVYSVDDAIDVASSMLKSQTNGFKQMEGYILKADESNILRWNKVELNDELQARFCSTAFYTGSEGRAGTLTEDGVSIGPLSRLFRPGNIEGHEEISSPFSDDGLTVIVSDLMEQNFDLDVLYQGVEDYYSKNSAAAVALLGCYSEYSGNMAVPVFSSNGTAEATISNYDGTAGYYFFIVGPVTLVETYVADLEICLERDDVAYDAVIFRNCPEPNQYASALSFEAIPDSMNGVKNLDDYNGDPANVLGSANTTNIISSAPNIVLGDIDSNTSMAMEDTFQLSAMADAQEGMNYTSSIVGLYSLQYIENEEDGITQTKWTPCPENAWDSLKVSAGLLTGKQVDYDEDGDEILVVPEGREVYMVQCSLTMRAGAIEDESAVYAVIVSYTGERPGSSQQDALERLMARSISTGDFDRALSSSLPQNGRDYLWNGRSDSAAAQALQCTPKLSNLLNALNNSSYQDGENPNYLAFVFDLQDR